MSKAGITYDMIIVGGGLSGCLMARAYSKAGLKCLLLEAGKHYSPSTYPDNEFRANAELYWGGGIEINTKADMGLLRPKAVGGGTIVNQALLDRFDEIALEDWRSESGIDFFTPEKMAPWYELAESKICKQQIPESARNENARLFIQGMEKNGYKWSPLLRAQKDCRYGEGNDCIECLQGCPVESKQSVSITALPEALKNGCELVSEFEVSALKKVKDLYLVSGKSASGDVRTFRAKYITLASGAVGNSKLLLASRYGNKNKQVGKNFYTHPQFMTLAIYDQAVNAHSRAFQSVKSSDPRFRAQRFKLENVFGLPVGISMLLPGFGAKHLKKMKKISHMACIEVAIRDQNPGEILLDSSGRLKIVKNMDERDNTTLRNGLQAIRNIFEATDAKEVIEGPMKLALHLMGGCGIGADGGKAVVSPDFHLHEDKNIFCVDSSIFPNAPGINPSLTIMAMNYLAEQKIIQRGL